MKENKWIYFGIFIDTKSQLRNLKALNDNEIEIPNDWKRFNHHMTIAFNNGSEESQSLYELYKPQMGKKASLLINGIGVSDDAIAIRVVFNAPKLNKIPHITIATPPNGKPVNSNKITKWFDIEPYTISGVLEQFVK